MKYYASGWVDCTVTNVTWDSCSTTSTLTSNGTAIWYWPAPTDSRGYEVIGTCQQQDELDLEADKKANEWLLSFLSDAQKKEWEKRRWFTVHSKDSKRRYQVTEHNRVYELDKEGLRIRSFCVHMKDQSLPLGDELCVKKLLLEHDEKRFLETANVTEMAAAA